MPSLKKRSSTFHYHLPHGRGFHWIFSVPKLLALNETSESYCPDKSRLCKRSIMSSSWKRLKRFIPNSRCCILRRIKMLGFNKTAYRTCISGHRTRCLALFKIEILFEMLLSLLFVFVLFNLLWIIPISKSSTKVIGAQRRTFPNDVALQYKTGFSVFVLNLCARLGTSWVRNRFFFYLCCSC